ncbi:putative quinol monooxygenase [Streptomyces sp. NPDC059982]|uniref:putative quinol monooxygenase n=1 Tax=unclassified Streptomyces TaxID=2593676 RepID=UPI0036CFE499
MTPRGRPDPLPPPSRPAERWASGRPPRTPSRGFLRPRPERADEVRRILSSFVEPTRREPGNLQYHLHEHEDGRFFLYEVWRSQEDLQRDTPAARLPGQPVDLPGGRPRGLLRHHAQPVPRARPGPRVRRTPTVDERGRRDYPGDSG